MILYNSAKYTTVNLETNIYKQSIILSLWIGGYHFICGGTVQLTVLVLSVWWERVRVYIRLYIPSGISNLSSQRQQTRFGFSIKSLNYTENLNTLKNPNVTIFNSLPCPGKYLSIFSKASLS